jgi:hypothetical protein
MIHYIIILIFYLVLIMIFLYYKRENTIDIYIPIDILKNQHTNKYIDSSKKENIVEIKKEKKIDLFSNNNLAKINYNEDKIIPTFIPLYNNNPISNQDKLKNNNILLPQINNPIYNQDNILPINNSNNLSLLSNSKQCCLIKKSFIEDNSESGGRFKYGYKKIYNDNCNYDLYNINENLQLLMDGEYNWDNNNCNEENNKLGSCRNTNKKCIDFVDKDFCDKYNMDWKNKTCNEPYEDFKYDTYKVDLINLNN